MFQNTRRRSRIHTRVKDPIFKLKKSKYKNLFLLNFLHTKEIQKIKYNLLHHLKPCAKCTHKFSSYYIRTYNAPFFDLDLQQSDVFLNGGYNYKFYYRLYNYFYKVLWIRILFHKYLPRGYLNKNKIDTFEILIHNNFMKYSKYKLLFEQFSIKIKYCSTLLEIFDLMESSKFNIFTPNEIKKLFKVPVFVESKSKDIFIPKELNSAFSFKKILLHNYASYTPQKFQIIIPEVMVDWNEKFWTYNSKKKNKKTFNMNVLCFYHRGFI